MNTNLAAIMAAASNQQNANNPFANMPGQTGNTANGGKDQPKANLWLNLGYTVQVKTEGESGITTEDKFISLPVGIPLDTMSHIDIRSSNVNFAQFQSARNDLLDQVIAAAADLAPGEAKIIQLDVELRRVNDPITPPAADSSNPFAVKLDL